MMEKSLRIPLSGVVYQDDKWWISHCLELDIVGQGETPEEAIAQSLELCRLQLDAAMEDGDIESVIRPAPKEIWALFYRAKGETKTSLTEQFKGSVIQRAEFRELCSA